MLGINIVIAAKNKPIVTSPKNVSPEQTNQDVTYCMSLAEQTYKSQGEGSTGGEVAKGAAKGAAVGAVGSKVLRRSEPRTRQNVRAGAVIGGASAGASSKGSKDQAIKSITSDCLTEKGYQIHGWN